MIRNLIYLDEQKMYSLSSQIFEGITEYVINENKKTEEKSESQKGLVGSGRVLADVLKAEENLREKKYLHDRSYSIFEKHLIEINKVLEVNAPDKIPS